MAKETKINFTDNDRAIVNALRDGDKTLAEINEVSGLTLVPGHIVSAMRKGLIAKVGEREMLKPSTREVSTYVFATGDILNDAEGKPFNYTDGAKAVLDAASRIDGEFTLADLAEVMGVDKVNPGSISHLVKKGNLTKGEMREIPTTVKSIVSVYGFVADIPNA